MKKRIFIALFVLVSLLFSCSYVMANTDNNLVEGVKSTVNDAGNMAADAGNATAGAIKDGANNVKDKTQDAMNNAKNGTEKAGNDVKNAAENAGNNVKDGMQNMGNDMNNGMNNQGTNDYTATRTATEQNTGNNTQNWMNRDIWTWIIVGIISIVIVALIWYYASRNNR